MTTHLAAAIDAAQVRRYHAMGSSSSASLFSRERIDELDAEATAAPRQRADLIDRTTSAAAGRTTSTPASAGSTASIR